MLKAAEALSLPPLHPPPKPALIPLAYASLSTCRAAAHAHSRVRRVFAFLPKSMNSRAGGLMGGASGDEGMLSQMAPVPACVGRREGVRGAAARSSEREATRSSEGREEAVCAESDWE